jgi:DNA-directed RNA polymerase specialized sigma24 family protein
MATTPPPASDGPERELREEEYEEISQRISKEELHDQIAQRGLEILDRGVPYVVQAARWRRIDAARRRSRERPLDSEPVDLGQIMSPFEAAVASEERRMLVDALAEFPDADVLAVWRHAEGIPDEEIAAAIEALGHRHISPAGVRKRRERALEKLRKLLEGKE